MNPRFQDRSTDSWAEVTILGSNPPYFDVFADGQRAIVGDVAEAVATDSTVATRFPLHFVLNWFEELK